MSELKDFQLRLEALADGIEKDWQKTGRALDNFSSLARDHLEKFPAISCPNLETMVSEMLELELPVQNFPGSDFSDFPLTLVRRDGFLIDVYFWYRSDTSIHDHHFCGAFRVINGASYQVSYNFTKEVTLGSCLMQGKIVRKEAAYLPLHSVREITPRDNFIHHVFHLEKPTVTLCVRTPPFKDEALSVYLAPHYRLTMASNNPTKAKHLQAFRLKVFQEGIPADLPFDDSEILRFLYLYHLGQLPSIKPLVPMLTQRLEAKGFAPNFFELVEQMGEENEILKEAGMELHRQQLARG